MATYLNIAGVSEDGTVVGATTTQPVGFHNCPAAQAAHITNATTTASTITTTPTSTVPLYVYTSTEMTTWVTAINSIITALENKGILAKS